MGIDTSKSIKRGPFLAGAAATGAAIFGGRAPYIMAATKEIVVGIDIPQSGPYFEQGQDQLRAYNLAIEEINAHGGIMGMQIRKVVADDTTTAGPATDNARRFIDKEGAVMITGGSSTGTALAVSKLCQDKKTMFMAALTHGDETSNQQCHKHTFRRYNDAYMAAQALAKTLVTKYGTGRWFHITADYSWGHSVYDNITAIVEPKGAKTVKNVLLKLGTVDFGSALSEAQAAKPDVLVITEFGRDMVNCLNQAKDFGLTKNCKILVPLVDEYMARGTGDNFDNVVATAPFYWQYHAQKYPGAKKFVDAFRAKYGTPPSNGAEVAYVDMYQYKSAVERAGTINPEAVIAKLEGWHFQMTKEPEYWRKDDHQGINSVLVMEGVPAAQRTGGDKWAFAKVLEEHSGESVAEPLKVLSCKMETA